MSLRRQLELGAVAGALLVFACSETSADRDDARATGGATSHPTAATCSPPPSKDAPFAHLGETGCFDAANPTQMAARVLPYEVNSPLWSDGADKTRGMALPAGGKVHVLDCAASPSACPAGPSDTGRWLFPAGTVFVKSFAFDGKLVETRLLARFDDGAWVGYSYAWNEQQTDAVIVPSERTQVTFDTGLRSVNWTFPSRRDCIKCHTVEGGSVLGAETAQLNRSAGGVNQLERWAELGIFDEPPAAPYQAALATPYPGQAGSPAASASLEVRARSYLHANCAFCHRPEGSGPSFDARNDVPLADTHMCNQPGEKGDQGVPGAVILAPRAPEKSLLFLRMQTVAENSGRMPSIGSVVADADGVKLVSDWIASIESCP